MTKPRTPTLGRSSPCLNVAWVWMLWFALPSALPAQLSLRITSSADGTLVYTGQSIKVAVEASGKLLQVMLARHRSDRLQQAAFRSAV